MPKYKYKCKDYGAVWHGWGEDKVCPECGGKLEPVPEDTATKNESGPPQYWMRVISKTLILVKDLNGGPGKLKRGFKNDSS